MNDKSSKPERLTGPLEVLMKTKHFKNVCFAESSPTSAIRCFSEADPMALTLAVRLSAEIFRPSHV
jgi:hypothetical protein